MNQAQVLRKLRRTHWRTLERMLREAYQQGVEQGRRRAHGQGSRGRTIREDATVQGLVDLIERHFGLDGYGFEVRIVNAHSKRRIPASALIRSYRRED